MLGHQQHRATPLAADGESLDEAEGDEQGGGPVADLTVGGQAAHQEGGRADEEETELEQLLAAELVAEVTEHDAAERPGDEADGVGGECRDDRVEFVASRREEDLAEYERRRGSVEEELIPFDDGAGHGCADHLLQPRWWGVDFGFRLVVDAHRGFPRLSDSEKRCWT